ncbi:MAG TPA: transcriptional repressor [Bellilinea sp.]|nr:transcriptional repressor [Bellilinea sp.]
MSKKKDLILSIVKHHHGHLTADSVYQQAKEVYPHLSLATVYRNLGTLAQDGEIRQVPMSGAPDLFDWRLDEHGHLICVDCGTVSDIPCMDIKELESQLGEKVLSFELTLYYRCQECRNALLRQNET